MRVATSLFALVLAALPLTAEAKVMAAVPRPEPVACSMEAKLCPDGSAVSRQGPNCEFAACPDGTPLPQRQHVAPMPVNPQKKPIVTPPDHSKDNTPDTPDATDGSEGGDEGSSGGDPDEGGSDDSSGE